MTDADTSAISAQNLVDINDRSPARVIQMPVAVDHFAAFVNQPFGGRATIHLCRMGKKRQMRCEKSDIEYRFILMVQLQALAKKVLRLNAAGGFVENHAVVGADGTFGVTLHGIQLRAQLARQTVVITIDMGDKIAAGFGMGGKVIGRRAAILFAGDKANDAGIPCNIIFDDAARPIGGAVISNDNLERLIDILRQDAVQTLADIGRLVVRDHANGKRGHHAGDL